MADRPYLVGAIEPSLAAEARALAARLRSSPAPRELRDEGAAMVIRLTEAGLAAFFVQPVGQLGLGVVATGAMRLGLKTALGGISLFVRQLVSGLSDEQLRGVAKAIDRLLIDLEEA